MVDKKPADRGVVDSIYALRLRRVAEYGPDSPRAKAYAAAHPKPTVDELRAKVAVITTKPKRPKKAKKGKRRAKANT